jgi:2-aminoadipate transaminase
MLNANPPTLAPAADRRGLRLAASVAKVRQSVLRDILVQARSPEVLSFALGKPSTDLFPRQALADAGSLLLATGGASLQYGPPCRSLKSQIVELMRLRRVACREEQIFLCNGAQQGLRLLAQLLLDPGAAVLLEHTVYDGFQAVISDFAPRLLVVPTNASEGIDVAAVEARLACGEAPAFLYVIPDGHNPLGISLSPEKRAALVALACRYRLPIIEDDACGLLSYEPVPPPLRALDDQWVLYVGSFSKILAPGLRVGWLVVPDDLVPALSDLKHATDCDTMSFSQHLVSGFLAAGALADHLALLRREYMRRRDALLAALRRDLPQALLRNRPQAGLYVWADLPPDLDATELLRVAIAEHKVAFCPGIAFATPGRSDGSHAIRLSFGNLSCEQIEEAVRRLARAVDRLLTTQERAHRSVKHTYQEVQPC